MNDISKKLNRQLVEWKKMFANHIGEKGLITTMNIIYIHIHTHIYLQICKELSQVSNKKVKRTNLKI